MEINQKNKKISVIVPVYNTPTDHLYRCIESLLSQDFKNSEIIIVDDGSDDSCKESLRQIAAKDSRIQLFFKENGGVSSARNYGLSKVTGDYLTFIDSDDYLDPTAWSFCINAMEERSVDMVSFGWQDHLADGTLIDHCIVSDFSMSTPGKYNKWLEDQHLTAIEETPDDGRKHVYLPTNHSYEDGMICDKTHFLAGIVSDNIYCGGGYPWNKIWKTSALLDSDGNLPKFDESLTIYEDKLWAIEAGARISSVLILPEIFYHYIFLPDSLTHKDDDIIDRQPLAYQAYDKILDFLEKDYPKCYIKGYNFYFDFIFDDITVLKDEKHRDLYQEQYKETKKTYKRLCKRIAPRTLHYPVCSPQFCSWAKEHFLP